MSPDDSRAAPLFARACDLGNGAACTLAGRLYEFSHGVAKDLPRAAALYGRACTLSDSAGCYNEAVVLEAGKGLPKDPARAALLYRRVCAQGSTIACASAERLRAPPPIAAERGAALPQSSDPKASATP